MTRAMHRAVLPVAVLIALVTALHAAWAGPLSDGFQEGEYLSAFLQIARGQAAPLLIHGQMDYLPARLALAFAGQDHLIAAVRLTNALFGFAASLAFLAGLRALAGRTDERLAATLLGAALLLVLNGPAASAIDLQQGAPAIRDLALLAELYLLIRASSAAQRNATILAALAGLVAGAALFWSYNRGVVGVIALGGWAAAGQLRGPRLALLAAPLAGLGAGLALLWLAEPAVFARHLANIVYWQAHQAIWAKAPDTLPDVVLAAVFAVGTLALFAWTAVRFWRGGHAARELATLAALGAAALLIAYAGLNRLDSFHIRFAVPFMTLLAVRLAVLSRPERLPVLSRNQWMLAAVTGLWLLAYVRPVPLLAGFVGNVAALAHGPSADRALAGPALSGAADALRAGGGMCTYTFDNSAALYHLSGLPPCARAMVPVYLAGAEEARTIAELSARRPPLVIGGSDAWYAAIDGKPLAQRTPALARWLTENYVPAKSIGGIELWRRKD